MSTSTTERATSPFGVGIEVKGSGSAVGVIATRDPYEFDIIGSVTGIKDTVNDIILPGAYEETLKARTPKIIKDHDWSRRLGKVLSIRELKPGDPGLPKTTSRGEPWPREAGALIAKVRLFKNTVEGREAAERWHEYGAEQEFSIGYQVEPGKAARDPKTGTRYIKGVNLFEISDVLWGAMPLAGPMPSGLAMKMLAAPDSGIERKDVDVEALADAMHEFGLPEVDWDEVTAAADALADPEPIDEAAVKTAPEFAVEVKRRVSAGAREASAKRGNAMPDGSFPIESEADLRNAISAIGRAKDPAKAKRHVMKRARALGKWDLIPEDWKSVKVGQFVGLDDKAAGGADKNRGNAENLRRSYVSGEIAARIRWGTDGDLTRCHAIAGKHMTSDQAWGYCNLRHHDALGTYNDPNEKAAPPIETKAAEKMTGTGVMVALYPPREVADQVAVDGGSDPDTLHVTLAFLGKDTDTSTDGREFTDVRDRIVQAVTTAAQGHQPLAGSIGGIGQFPEGDDGVPVWTPVDAPGMAALREDIVAALAAAGTPAKTDHGFTPHMTLGYDVDASEPIAPVSVRFDSVAVVVGADRVDVPLGQSVDVKAAAYDPTLEVGPHAGTRPPSGLVEDDLVEVKDARLPGTVEERQERIRSAVIEALRGDPIGAPEGAVPTGIGRYRWWVSIDGTYPDRVVATRMDETSQQSASETYEVPYEVLPDGTVQTGEPAQVRLVVSAVPDVNDARAVPDDEPVTADDLAPVADVVEDLVFKVKHLAWAAQEAKAGRVLSSRNANRLRLAMTNLLAVLAGAGIRIEPTGDLQPVPDGDEDRYGEAITPPDTTSRQGAVTVAVKSLEDTLAELTEGLDV